jgi:hypothetical protein
MGSSVEPAGDPIRLDSLTHQAAEPTHGTIGTPI